MKFEFKLTHNESMETEDYETGNYEWKHGNNIVIDATDFQDAINVFFRRYKVDLNEILDGESNDSEDGHVYYGNTTDGLSLRFDVECKG